MGMRRAAGSESQPGLQFYPCHDWSVIVTHCGRIGFKGRKINLSHVFAGQKVGIKQVEDRIWLVSFMHST